MINPLFHSLDEESDLDRALGYEDYCAWRSRYEEPNEVVKMAEETKQKTVAEMDEVELAAYIVRKEQTHKLQMRRLRALLAVLQSQEGE